MGRVGAGHGEVGGRTASGVSPLSCPVPNLTAPILVEMEWRIRGEVPGIEVEFPSYVDDLHCGLYDQWASCSRMEEL